MEEKDIKLIAGSSPHLKSGQTTSIIMRDVIVALIPAAAAAVYFFRLNALLVIITAVGSCVAAEYVCNKIMKKSVTIGDYSAAVTGILLAFNLPPAIPLWMTAVGGVFAIIITKQLFGGLGIHFGTFAQISNCLDQVIFCCSAVFQHPCYLIP